MKFKTGDKVRCINIDNRVDYGIRLNEVYTIDKYSDFANNEVILKEYPKLG